MDVPRRRKPAVREIDIPVPEPVDSPERLLEIKLGPERAARLLAETAAALGVPPDAPASVLSAVALAKIGSDLNTAARTLRWDDFERFCAMAISASGFHVRTNIRLKKPTRQIDIVAESPSFVLAIDCKHWQRGAGAASLELIASAQLERTRMLASRLTSTKPHLPVVLTVFDNSLRVVLGVPIVPIHVLKDFLSSVSAFDRDFAFISA
jgi:hypothetical protein